MTGKIFQSILVGVFGSVILIIFFTGLMSLGTIEKVLPWVIGFNALLTGYNLINKTGNFLKYKRIFAVGAGIVMVITTTVFLDIIFFYLMGGYLIFFMDFLFLLLLGAILSGFGGILAIKFLNLQ